VKTAGSATLIDSDNGDSPTIVRCRICWGFEEDKS